MAYRNNSRNKIGCISSENWNAKYRDKSKPMLAALATKRKMKITGENASKPQQFAAIAERT
jgi:hypothetical protein